MQDGMGIFEHLIEFSKIICQLTNIWSKFEKEDKALIMLSSLPLSYEHLITTLFYGKDSINLENVTIVFLSNEMIKNGSIDEV